MKIAVGLFYLECNTFNPDLVGREQFIFAEGQQVLPYLHVCDIFQEEGFELVPTIMASTLPAGRLKEDDFWFFANKILNTVRADVYKRQELDDLEDLVDKALPCLMDWAEPYL